MKANTPQQTVTPQYSSLAISTVPRGTGINLCYGTNKVTASLIWAGPLTNQKYTQNSGSGGKGGVGGGGGKGGGTGAVTYYYFAPLMGAICEGPIQRFIAARTGSTWVFFDGTTAPPSWPAVLGNTPGYAGVEAVNAGGYEGYPLLAQIGQPDMVYRTHMQTAAMGDDFGGLWAFWEANDMLDSEGNINPINNNGFLWDGQQWNHVASSVWESQGFTLMYGTALQPPPPYILTTYPGQALSYHYTAYWFSPLYQLGQTATPPSMEWWIAGLFCYDYMGLSTGFYIMDADPRDFAYDILTSGIHGCGLSTRYIDYGGTWLQFHKFCVASGFFLSAVLDGQQQAKDILTEIAKETVTSFWWSEGVLKCLPWYDQTQTGYGVTYTPNLIPVYTIMDDHLLAKGHDDGPLEMQRTDPADAYNQLSVNFGDRSANYSQNTVTVDDQAAQELYGLRPAPAAQAMYIADSSVAQISCILQLQKQLYQRVTYTFNLPWFFFLLEPMDIVVLWDQDQGIVGVGARMQKMELQDDGSYNCTAAALLDEVYSIQARNQQPGLGNGLDIGKPPGHIDSPIIFTGPLALTNEVIQIWIAVAGVRPSWGGCVVHMSTDGQTYASMGEFWGPSKYGETANQIPTYGGSNPDTSDYVKLQMYPPREELKTVNAAQAAASLTLGMLIGGTTEVFCYETAQLLSRNANNQITYKLSTLYRGLLGTPAAAHNAGEIYVRLDDNLIKLTIDQSLKDKTVWFKFCSFNTAGANMENLASVTAYPYTVGYGISNPFGPSDLTVGMNGQFVVFTWQEDQSPHVKGYEVRYGVVGGQWATAFTAFRVAANVFHFVTQIIPPGTWEFYVASFDQQKNYSKFQATDQFTVIKYSYLCENNFGALNHTLDVGSAGWPDWGVGQTGVSFTGCSPHPTYWGLIETDTAAANYSGPYSGYDLWESFCLVPAVAEASWIGPILDTLVNGDDQRISDFCYTYMWGLMDAGTVPTVITKNIVAAPGYSGWTFSECLLHPTTYDVLPDSTVGINYVPSGGTGYEVWQNFVYLPMANPVATYMQNLEGYFPLEVIATSPSSPGAGQPNNPVPPTITINYSSNGSQWLTAASGQGSQTAFIVAGYIQIEFALDVTDAVSYIDNSLVNILFGPSLYWTNIVPEAQFSSTTGGFTGNWVPFNSGGPAVRYCEFMLSWPTSGLPWPVAPASLWMNADIQIQAQNGFAECTSPGTFFVPFGFPFQVIDSIQVAATAIVATPGIQQTIVCSNFTLTGFTAEIFNSTGAPSVGNISWTATGY